MKYLILLLTSSALLQCGTPKLPTMISKKAKAIVFNSKGYQNWVLNLEKLKLVDDTTNLTVVWDIDVASENHFWSEEPFSITDEKGKKHTVKSVYQKEGNNINNYEISLTKTQSAKVQWTYSPKRPNTLGKSVQCKRIGNQLFIAIYHIIATGSDLVCVDWETGKEIWHADVEQLLVGHSKYKNVVYLEVIEDKVMLIGDENGGRYIQVFDTKTGKKLWSKKEKKW